MKDQVSGPKRQLKFNLQVFMKKGAVSGEGWSHEVALPSLWQLLCAKLQFGELCLQRKGQTYADPTAWTYIMLLALPNSNANETRCEYAVSQTS